VTLNTKLCLLLGATLLLLAPRSALATERHFGFTYESSVLNAGTAEVEPWTTVRVGRSDYYSATDARIAFGYGIAKNLQGGLYWNFSTVAEDLVVPGAAQKTRLNDSELDSFSLDLEYKLSDPVADAFGSALYVAGTLGPLLASVEGRVILDKQLGSVVLAANLVGAGIEHLELRSTSEVQLAAVASAGYFVTPTFVPGLEVRSENGVSKQLDRSVLYFGPSVSVLTEGWWATLALEPQITALKGATPGRSLDLDHNERLQARLLFGFRI
jgi:hypothetical protein